MRQSRARGRLTEYSRRHKHCLYRFPQVDLQRPPPLPLNAEVPEFFPKDPVGFPPPLGFLLVPPPALPLALPLSGGAAPSSASSASSAPLSYSSSDLGYQDRHLQPREQRAQAARTKQSALEKLGQYQRDGSSQLSCIAME